jgi:hypothetical protein
MKRIVLYALSVILIVWLVLFVYLPYRPVDLVTNNADTGWNPGSVFHILPTVNHDRILIKASLTKALSAPPHLKIGERLVIGEKTDTKGYFWQFDAQHLSPRTTYQIVIQDASGVNLCDPWPLATFPSPEEAPDRLRLLIYTGLGGHDANIEWFGSGPFA